MTLVIQVFVYPDAWHAPLDRAVAAADRRGGGKAVDRALGLK
jgi:hypothetical protein